MSEVCIGVIGGFDPESPTHRATNEALDRSGSKLGAGVDVSWLPTWTLERGAEAKLSRLDGLWCAPGSPYASLEGAVEAVRFVRENDRPFIGACGGFQHAILECARNVLGFDEAAHAEYDPYASTLFITPLSYPLAGKTMRVQTNKVRLPSLQFLCEGGDRRAILLQFRPRPGSRGSIALRRAERLGPRRKRRGADNRTRRPPFPSRGIIRASNLLHGGGAAPIGDGVCPGGAGIQRRTNRVREAGTGQNRTS